MTRYARLMQAFPQRAEKLFNEAAQNAKVKYEKLLKLQKLYNTDRFNGYRMKRVGK